MANRIGSDGMGSEDSLFITYYEGGLNYRINPDVLPVTHSQTFVHTLDMMRVSSCYFSFLLNVS